MKLYQYEIVGAEILKKLCTRNSALSQDVVDAVSKIECDILARGDDALRELTERFDGVKINNFKVSHEELSDDKIKISEDLRSAIKIAKENIWKFHAKQLEDRIGKKVETSKGVFCWQEFRAIERAGLYIPGGSAPLFSTVLMLAIPALIAGCKKIVLCTPPNKEGNIAPEILWTAKFLGLEEIYKVGGAQAIFALSSGTEQIPKVDKIFGPGNRYVTAAKLNVSTKTPIDMPAGPSEALIIVDENVNAKYVAADLLAQAEHGADSQVVLLGCDEDKLREIINETENQLKDLPRNDVAEKALENSFAILVPNLNIAIDFSNLYAPEHLLLAIDNFEEILPKIENAGSVFCGSYTSVAFGDYASGTNHTLPTSGFARSYSGLSMNDFGKWVTFQSVTKEGLKNLGKVVEVMAENEGLLAHKNAVSVRLENEK